MAVGTHCTQICGGPGFTGRSCARIVPVRIYPEGHPEKSVLAYSMLDDQTNKTQGRNLLFNRLGIDSTPIEYTMQCCSGKAISLGRVAHGLIVEGLDRAQSIQLKLPPVLECDSLPDNHTEIPTSDIARCYTHPRDIAESFYELDSSAKILLLIGRDLPKAHHSLDQRTGPLGAPFAQRSPLGWTIIGNVCLSGHHIPTTRCCSSKTFINENGRPSTL